MTAVVAVSEFLGSGIVPVVRNRFLGKVCEVDWDEESGFCAEHQVVANASRNGSVKRLMRIIGPFGRQMVSGFTHGGTKTAEHVGSSISGLRETLE